MSMFLKKQKTNVIIAKRLVLHNSSIISLEGLGVMDYE